MSSSGKTDEQRARERELLARLWTLRESGAGVDDPQVRAARDEVVALNQGLVVHTAIRLAGRGEHLEDLVQAGNIGLLAAIDRFDPSVGAELGTFATKHMLGEMRQHLSTQAWSTRVPRRVQELAIAVARTRPELTAALGRSPTVDELAEQLDTSPEAILDAIEAGYTRSAGSLEAPIDADGTTVGEVVGGLDAMFSRVDEVETVRSLLAALPDRQREVIELIYFEGLSQSEAGARLGISQMHVSRLHSAARDAMRGNVET